MLSVPTIPDPWVISRSQNLMRMLQLTSTTINLRRHKQSRTRRRQFTSCDTIMCISALFKKKSVTECLQNARSSFLPTACRERMCRYASPGEQMQPLCGDLGAHLRTQAQQQGAETAENESNFQTADIVCEFMHVLATNKFIV